MGKIASQITSLTSVYSTVYSGVDQSKHQSSASLTFVWGIHRGPVNSPHKWPVTRKMFPFDDVIMWEVIISHLFWIYHARVLSWTKSRVYVAVYYNAGLIPGLRPANERLRYFLTTSLIDWAQTYNQSSNVYHQANLVVHSCTILAKAGIKLAPCGSSSER